MSTMQILTLREETDPDPSCLPPVGSIPVLPRMSTSAGDQLPGAIKRIHTEDATLEGGLIHQLRNPASVPGAARIHDLSVEVIAALLLTGAIQLGLSPGYPWAVHSRGHKSGGQLRPGPPPKPGEIALIGGTIDAFAP